jgi:hypothetical protein
MVCATVNLNLNVIVMLCMPLIISTRFLVQTMACINTDE